MQGFESVSLSNTRNGMTIQAIFVDENGNPSRLTSQTTVNGVSGKFYMALKILTSNTGNAILTNVRIQESHPDSFTDALQGASAIQPTLAVGESNVLQWDTANACTSDAQCGTGEKCLTNNKCYIDISNFLGEEQFGVTLEADYSDAQGNPYTVSTLINLPFTFEQDEVIFRTDASGGNYGVSGTQIAIDRESDGTLESYIYTSGGSEGYYPSDFIGYTVQDNIIFKCGTSTQVCITESTILNKDEAQSVQRWKYSIGGTLPTTKTPTEPYLSQNCGGIKPCQERYSVAVSPQTQECGNDIIEGTELCDGVQPEPFDFGGNDCISIGMGFTGGILNCDMTQNPCQAWDIDQCTGEEPPTENVKFRSTSWDYSGFAPQAVGYSNVCGNVLVQYGYEAKEHSGDTCIERDKYGGTLVTGIQGIDGGYNGGTIWILFQDADDSDEIWLCQDDGDGSGSIAARYDSGDSDASVVSTSQDSINPSLEVAC